MEGIRRKTTKIEGKFRGTPAIHLPLLWVSFKFLNQLTWVLLREAFQALWEGWDNLWICYLWLDLISLGCLSLRGSKQKGFKGRKRHQKPKTVFSVPSLPQPKMVHLCPSEWWHMMTGRSPQQSSAKSGAATSKAISWGSVRLNGYSIQGSSPKKKQKSERATDKGSAR